uniref:Uncharacterized protein n=1 Tax=Rhizophora mucronata TaxID=61149 RepID=A0A2P2NMK4_RHIMU
MYEFANMHELTGDSVDKNFICKC